MGNIYQTTTLDRKRVPLLPIRYGENPVETALFAGNLKMLSKDSVDFKMPIQGIVKKTELSQDGKRIFWDIEDRRRETMTIASVASATSFDVTAVTPNLKPGSSVYNKATMENASITAVTGNTITLLAPWFTSPLYLAGNQILDSGHAKKYGQDDGKLSYRKDYNSYSNFIQIDERTVPVDMIENNKTYLDIEPGQRHAEKVADVARDAMMDVMFNFYFGKGGEDSYDGGTHYRTGGLDQYIMPNHKRKISTSQTASFRAKIMEYVREAYQSGIPGINQPGKMIFVCTSKAVEHLSSAFGDNIQYNDQFKDYSVEIKTIRQNGFSLTFMTSTFLDFVAGDSAMGYYIPIEHIGTFCFPYTGQTGDDGKRLEKYNFTAVYYKKPVTTIETSTSALWMQYGFMFWYHTTPAFQRWIFA